MKSDFFIDRPVFSTVLSVVIVIVGLLGLVMLPVDQYPRIVPPVVKISASYPGASAQTVTQAVATPIEQELNGTPGMLYMESTSSNSGGFSATVTFDIDTDADLAAVEIQNRVKQADPQVDPETGTFSVRAEMANPDRILLPGQFTKVRLLLDVREDATVVPTKSVVIEKGGAYIFVIRPDSIAERRLIELGPEVNNRVIVERGVVPGEKIVVEGFHKLTHGDKVDPVPVPEKSSATETEASEK